MKKLSLLSVLALFSALSAATITTTGTGYNQDAAVQSALRSAVEQSIGLSISSETVVKNAAVISDNILSHSSGYVSSFDILSQSNDFGLVTVQVKAVVETIRPTRYLRSKIQRDLPISDTRLRKNTCLFLFHLVRASADK
jgi:hypothetical protein